LLGLSNAESVRVWPPVREAARPTADDDTHIELEFRSRTLQFGSWFGWLSIVAVLGGLALDAGSKHR
jgi:hypothetical protein